MKIDCSQAELSKAISIVGRAVSPRSTLPILGNILLEAKGGELRLAASNLEMSVNCWIRANVEREGAITLPARLLGEIVGKMAHHRASIELVERTQTARLRSGSLDASLRGLPAYDFPIALIESEEELASLSAPVLQELIDQSAYAASRDPARSNLYSVRVKLGAKRLLMVGCDGFRLAIRCLELSTPATEREILIPHPAMLEVARLLGESDKDAPAALGMAKGDQLVVEVAGKDFLRATLIARSVDSKYPDYAAIIPKATTTTVAIETATLRHALQTANIFARLDSDHVRLQIDPAKDHVRISTRTSESGESIDDVQAEIKGKAVDLWVDVGFLLDAVSRVRDPQVVLEMTLATRPMLIRPFAASPDEALHVVMPVIESKK